MNPAAEWFNRTAESWAAYTIDAAWQASLVAALVLCAVWLGRRWGSHLRYAVLLIALLKFLLPPFAVVPFGLCDWVGSAWMASRSAQDSSPVAEVSRGSNQRSDAGEMTQQELASSFALNGDGADDRVMDSSLSIHIDVAQALPNVVDEGRPASALPRWNPLSASTWTAKLMLLHAIGGLFVAVWIVVQQGHLNRLRSSAVEATAGIGCSTVTAISRRLGLRRSVTLLASERAITPMAFGILRPVIVLPATLMDRMTAAQRRTLIAHELAHHCRWDQPILLVQAAVLTLWWFHPLAWLLNGAINRAREECCDDLILRSGLTSRGLYGETLMRIAEYLFHDRALHAIVRSAPMHPLGNRISRVMDATVPRHERLPLAGFLAVTMLACFLLPGVAPRPISSADRETAPPDRTDPDADRETSSASGNDLYGDPLPEGAIARLGTLRFRQGEFRPTERVAFVDEDTFVTADRNWLVLVDRQSGRTTRRIDTGSDEIHTFAVAPDRLRIATISRKYIQEIRQYLYSLGLWNVASGESTITQAWLDGPASGTNSLAFSRDATVLVTAGSDAVRFVDVRSGDEILTDKVQLRQIQAVAFAPDSDVVAVAGRDGVLLWSWLAEDEPVLLELPHRRGAMAVTFSPNGQYLATLSDDANGLRLWSVDSKKLFHRFDAEDRRYYAHDIAFTSDGRFLVVPGGSESPGVEFWEVATGELSRTLKHGLLRPRSVSLTEDDQWLVSGSRDVIHVWNVTTNKLVGGQFAGHEGSVWEHRFSPDGRTIATGGSDGTFRLWDSTSGRQLQLLRHEGMVRSVAFSARAPLLASSSMDDTVGLWDLETGHRQFELVGHGRLGGRREVRFSPDGKELLSWGDDWYLRRWDVRTGKALAEHAIRPIGVEFTETEDGGLNAVHFDPVEDGRALAQSVEFTSDASQLLISLGGSLYAFDVDTGKQLRERKFDGRFEEALLTPDDQFVITREQLSDEEALQQGDPAHNEDAWTTVFRVRDFDSFEAVREIKLPGRQHYFPAISPRGRFLAHLSAGSPWAHDPERWISIWEIESATEYARITGFDTQPYCLSFSPDENRLASSHADTTILVWELERFRK